MPVQNCDSSDLPAATRVFYRHALAELSESGIPFMICGSYALAEYTQLGRSTRDLDVLVCKEDCSEALAVLSAAGYSAEVVFPHWLAKIRSGDDCMDVIFNSGNGICVVDQSWFVHARRSELFGVPVLICPPEEALWQQSFIMERERFDGADVIHLIHAQGKQLNWDRLLRRFGEHWRVLLSHLILYGFVYPAERDAVPEIVMQQLMSRLQKETMLRPWDGASICQGTLLSRAQYLGDLRHGNYIDARLLPPGTMTEEDVQIWTAAIQQPAAACVPG